MLPRRTFASHRTAPCYRAVCAVGAETRLRPSSTSTALPGHIAQALSGAPLHKSYRRSTLLSHGGFAAMPDGSFLSEKEGGDGGPAEGDRAMDDIDRDVDAVIGLSSGGEPAAKEPPLTRKPAECWTATPVLRDSRGVRIDSPALMETWNELVEAVPKLYADALRKFINSHGIEMPTPFQAAAIPLLMRGHSATLFAPTGAGKTLAFLTPIFARIQGARDLRTLSITPVEAKRRSSLARAADAHEAHVCTYCGLDMAKVSVCPETGAPHPRIVDDLDAAAAMYDGDHDAVIDAAAKLAERRREQREREAPIAMIVVPTALLARQVFGVAMSIRGSLKIALLVHEKKADPNAKNTENRLRGADVVVATTEQALARIEAKRLRLDNLETLVVDEIEAQMLMSNYDVTVRLVDQVRRIRRSIVTQKLARETDALETATAVAAGDTPTKANDAALQLITVGAFLTTAIEQLMHDLHKRRLFLLTSDQGSGVNDSVTTTIDHTVLLVSEAEKIDRVRDLFMNGDIDKARRVMVFVNSRRQCAHVAAELSAALADEDVRVGTVRASMPMEDQFTALKRFTKGVDTVLVCTDLCAHGLDFENVDTVINFDMPTLFSRWVHRCGRCGRHGHRGNAVTLFTTEDMANARPLVRALRQRSQRVPPRLSEYANLRQADILRRSRALGPGLRQLPNSSRPLTAPLEPAFPSRSALRGQQTRKDPSS